MKVMETNKKLLIIQLVIYVVYHHIHIYVKANVDFIFIVNVLVYLMNNKL